MLWQPQRTLRGEDYLKLAAFCTTPNQLNRLHIKLETSLTPNEIAALGRDPELPRNTKDWLEKLRRLSPALFSAPQPFARRVLNAHVTAYENNDVKRGGKGLLLGFSGNAKRMMMPAAVFLQFFDARAWDVVIVKKPSGTSYLDDVDGVRAKFGDLVGNLKTETSPQDYARVVTFGTSSGGFAAILAAIAMRATRGISICGYPPKSFDYSYYAAQQENAKCDLRFIYGAGSTYDRERANELAGELMGRAQDVKGPYSHFVLGELLRRGQLADFFADVLS